MSTGNSLRKSNRRVLKMQVNAKLSSLPNKYFSRIHPLLSLLPRQNKTHINKVQHLTNKLSQSSFAVLGNFIQEEYGSQFTVLSALSSFSLTLTHAHTAMRKLNVSPSIHFIPVVTAAGTVPAHSSWAGTMIGWVLSLKLVWLSLTYP